MEPVEKIGAETPTYVRKISKSYMAYKLALGAHEAKQQAREELK